ncbi:MAG: sulfurtransferase TusA family protein [Deltaproteobacteria bacterium]|nr:sulfurtransferase TusA family protein [Deltaproteobacteria bacterium]
MEILKEIDVTGKVCPAPLIALAKEVRHHDKGALLRIKGDDPLFEESILDFCAEGDHKVVETKREGKRISIVLQT